MKPYRPALKVGDTVWRFDSSHRVYGADRSAPIWREHWRPQVIVGQTTKSWQVGYRAGARVLWLMPKVNPDQRVWAASTEAIEQASWVQDNGWRIADKVRLVDRYDLLQQVAQLVGYTGRKP